MSASRPRQLTIVHFPDGWRILSDAGRWGRFNYRVDAEEAAIRLARRARAEGGPVEVWVQDICGRLDALDAA